MSSFIISAPTSRCKCSDLAQPFQIRKKKNSKIIYLASNKIFSQLPEKWNFLSENNFLCFFDNTENISFHFFSFSQYLLLLSTNFCFLFSDRFCIVHAILLLFLIFFLCKDFDIFHEILFKSFLCFFDSIQPKNLLTFCYMRKKVLLTIFFITIKFLLVKQTF